MEEEQINQINDDNYSASRELDSNILPSVQGDVKTSALFSDIKPVDLIPPVETVQPVEEVVPIDNEEQVETATDNNHQDNIEVNNNDEIEKTIPIDPFVSSNIDVEDVVEEPVIQRVIDVEEEKKKKIMKIVLISLGGLLGLILVITLLVILFTPKKKNNETIQHREVEDASFSGIISRSIRDGEFDRELEDALKDLELKTDKVYLIPMDLDSDEIVDLVAYVETEEKKYLLQFDVDEEVLFADSFPLQSKDAFGYVYSLTQNTSNWCSISDDQFTIIHHRKMVLKNDDFNKEYYTVTQDYNGKKVLENALEYEINGEFDASKLDEITITKETLLKNNNITSQDMRSKAEEYFNQKKEEDAKNKAESEKAKNLEEQRNEVFGLNGVILRYGTYVQESGTYGNLVINKDGSCMIGATECHWSFSNHEFNGSNIPSILIQFNDISIQVSSWSSNCISDNSSWSVMYQG